VGSIGGKTIALSQDHKPNLPLEKARVHAAGGTVTSMMGCYRVMGMLAMSRALGDVMIEQYLSQEPDVTEQQVRAIHTLQLSFFCCACIFCPQFFFLARSFVTICFLYPPTVPRFS